MKLTQKITQNLIFGLCLLTIPILYARTRQVAVKPTETILKPATVQTQATPTPVAKFKGTVNDYTPAEMKAMIAQQTRDRKEGEADAKAIANGTYKERKPIVKKEHVRTKPVTWEEVEEGNEIVLKMQDAETLEEYKEARAELNAYMERIRKR
jgi:hypothetical protein